MAEQLSEAAVLFADVSGSTKLYETAGDTVAHAAIEKCVNIMREKTVNAKGRVIKTIQVKGKAQEIQGYELIWQQSEDMTTLASQKSVYKPKNAKLRLIVQGADVILSSERPAVALGRDASADLVIKERMASRAHGKIERRLDKFILTDHSANGTFITIEGDKEIVLRREEFTLRGHGWVAFGQSRATATDVLEFFCE